MRYSLHPIRIAVAIAAAVALAGFLVWLLLLRGDGSAIEADGEPVIATQSDLKELAQELGHPIYWAGEQEGARLEATRLSDDQVYVRYLENGAPVGDPRPDFLSIGTYPVREAFQTLGAAGQQPDTTAKETDNGALAIQSEVAPSNVYMAFPEEDLQIEVYDPDPERALKLAVSGDVVAIE